MIEGKCCIKCREGVGIPFLGEQAECAFMKAAMDRGLVVSKPFGDSARYDFIVDADGRLSRVQVKSAWVLSRRGAYQFGASRGEFGGRFALLQAEECKIPQGKQFAQRC